MEDLDPRVAAKVLATSTWRRDFEENDELQAEAHKTEVASFMEALKQELGALAEYLHDDHSLGLDQNETTLSLTEGRRQRPLARCHINKANVGALYLQYMSDVEEERRDELHLIRIWRDQYGWYRGGKILSSSEAAQLCLSRLLRYANSIVARTVNRNPKLEGQ